MAKNVQPFELIKSTLCSLMLNSMPCYSYKSVTLNQRQLRHVKKLLCDKLKTCR